MVRDPAKVERVAALWEKVERVARLWQKVERVARLTGQSEYYSFQMSFFGVPTSLAFLRTAYPLSGVFMRWDCGVVCGVFIKKGN